MNVQYTQGNLTGVAASGYNMPFSRSTSTREIGISGVHFFFASIYQLYRIFNSPLFPVISYTKKNAIIRTISAFKRYPMNPTSRLLAPGPYVLTQE